MKVATLSGISIVVFLVGTSLTGCGSVSSSVPPNQTSSQNRLMFDEVDVAEFAVWWNQFDTHMKAQDISSAQTDYAHLQNSVATLAQAAKDYSAAANHDAAIAQDLTDLAVDAQNILSALNNELSGAGGYASEYRDSKQWNQDDRAFKLATGTTTHQ